MRINKKLNNIINEVASEPFAEDRVIGIKRLIRTAYNEGLICAKKEESDIKLEVSDIKDKIIGGLLEGSTVEIRANKNI